MASTTYTENLSQLVENYDTISGNSTALFKWNILLNGRPGVREQHSILPYPNIANEKIVDNNGELSIYLASESIKYNKSPIYTNPSTIEFKLDRDISTMSVFEVDISSIKRSSDNRYRSFDLFESLSEDVYGDYMSQEHLIGYSNGTIDIGVVLLRAPSMNKTKNPRKYLGEIIDRGAIGKLGTTSFDFICNESHINDDEIILALVYRKDGRYYDTNNNEIVKYSTNEYGTLYKYFGSNNIKQFTLSMVGNDGRYLKDNVFDTSLIKYSNEFIGNPVYNKSFIPKKELNTVENSYSINKNNELKILTSHRQSGDIQIISFLVSVNGNTYSTDPMLIDNGGVQLKPIIRTRDFSSNSSLNISAIKITEGDVVDSLNEVFSSYLTKYMSPVIFPNITGSEVLLDSSTLSINIFNYNVLSSTIYYELSLNGNMISSGDYSSTINITNPGKYSIKAYVYNETYPERISSEITYSVTVLRKAMVPAITITTTTLDGITNKDVEVYFTSDDNISTIFTTNGTTPIIGSGDYYVAKNGMVFKFTKDTTITYYAYSDGYLKSDTTIHELSITYTQTTPAPSIDTSDATTYSDRAELIITPDDPSDIIRYTLDGTSPTESSPIYITGTYVVAPTLGTDVIINAVAFRYGFSPSTVTSKTIVFNYTCNPWEVEGDVNISAGSASINKNGRIIRFNKVTPDYKMLFNIESSTIGSILELAFRASINDVNNYSGIYSSDNNIIITTMNVTSDYIIYSLGVRDNRHNLKKGLYGGEIIVPTGTPLLVEYELIKNSDGIDTLINGDSFIKNIRYLVNVSLYNGFERIYLKNIQVETENIDNQMMTVNAIYANNNANVTIGNITFKCI